MAAISKGGSSWFTVILIIAAAAVWIYDYTQKVPGKGPRPVSAGTIREAGGGKPGGASDKTGNYETYRNCTLVAAPHNDGDSFMVRLPDGKQAEFRLYFVDTPESAFKSYAGGETNRERISQQAGYFGNVTPEQAVGIGKKAAEFTLPLLGSQPFVVHTCWDSPYHDDRFHAFVEVKLNDRTRWLHELLVERGYVRIYTKGADLPDGTSLADHKERLKQLERAAKSAHVGAWGL